LAVALGTILLAAPLLLSGLDRGVIRHGDEGRFVVAAREAARTGQWLVPPVLGEPEFRKPALHVWLVAASAAARGRLDELAARLPGALAALAGCGALAMLGTRLAGPTAGLVAGLTFATAIGPFSLSREVLPDMPMTAASIVAVLAAMVADRERSRWAALVFAAALAVAVQFKLSAGLIPPLGTVALIALARRSLDPIRALRPLLTVPVFLVLLAPWLARYFLIEDFARIVDVEAGSARVWGDWAQAVRSIVRAPVILLEQALPWTLFVPGALAYLWSERRRWQDARVLVPVAWLLVTLGMVMLVHQRWRYLLPAVAPLALLLAVAWDATLRGAAPVVVSRLLRLPLAGLLAVFAGAGAVVLAGVDGRRLLDSWPAFRSLPWLALPLVSLVGGVAGLVLLRGRTRAALLVAIGLVGVAVGSLHVLTIEQRNRPVDPRPFAREVKRIVGDSPIHYCCDDSLASHLHVYLDAPTTLLDQAGAERLLREGAWRYLLIAAHAIPAIGRERFDQGGGRVLTEGRFGGYHFVLLERD
jgi:4-amino-4-deoxy-L-arabinose transferase-like glycosyltransferase